ncbi:SagB/ThcOx family dehydrogenase [Isachenkonia alkalipeptolytica]|uniref:SagB/ThcOx family dehydrogenase n=1 Tax=Isachenkonia alkalipeptolytica TaxID=2565777 RepID=A0AA43XJW5_9CLOT|nr:SagB/ThcOx family dehydrogenase [Isachenkonia alkalipeptolytica]NBG87245.1 SagB/ThcOx family dehydrogenase [Isachenkonia alkalipeptolytica]
MKRFEQERNMLKSGFSGEMESDQMKGMPQPPLEKPMESEDEVIDLPEVTGDLVTKKDVFQCIMDRRSHRNFKEDPMSLAEVSFLLYTTQGVKEVRGGGYASIRPVPSAGARHPFETYIGVTNVEGLEKGIYRYSGLKHQLIKVKTEEEIGEKMTIGARGQKFVGEAPVTFIWTVIPYRGEWRYDQRSHKPMLLDAGHLCHGLYLSAEALNLGTCAIAAYEQKLMDEIVGVDGEEEFVVYMSPVGKV